MSSKNFVIKTTLEDANLIRDALEKALKQARDEERALGSDPLPGQRSKIVHRQNAYQRLLADEF